MGDKKFLLNRSERSFLHLTPQTMKAPFWKERDPILQRACLDALENIQALIGSDPEDLHYFTASYSTLLIELYFGAVKERSLHRSSKKILITEAASELEKLTTRRAARIGLETEVIPMGASGRIDLLALERALKEGALIVSLPYADPRTGVMQPIFEAGELARRYGSLLHVDLTSVLGRIFVHLEGMPIDFASWDGRALGGAFFPSLLWRSKKECESPLLFDDHNPLQTALGFADQELLLASGQLAEGLMIHLEEEAFLLGAMQTQVEGSSFSAFKPLFPFFEQERVVGFTAISFPGIDHRLLVERLISRAIFVGDGGKESIIISPVPPFLKEDELLRVMEIISQEAAEIKAIAGDLEC